MDRQIEHFFICHGEIQATDQNDSLKTVEYDTKKILGLAHMYYFWFEWGGITSQKIHINTPIPPPSG